MRGSDDISEGANLLHTGTILGVENVDRGRVLVRVAVPDGLLFVGGLANSYQLDYSSEVPFDEVLSRHELEAVVKQFNSAIQSYWPCSLCYTFGCLCAPLTLGLSLCVPNMCISEAEHAGVRSLEHFCLRRQNFDRQLRIRLVKSWKCTSWLELSFPMQLLRASDRSERGHSRESCPASTTVTEAETAIPPPRTWEVVSAEPELGSAKKSS